MNLKALITSLSLALGTSSAAMAKPIISFSGSATVSVGSRPIVRDHRIDDCDDAPPARPVYQPVNQPVYAPVNRQPVWRAPYFNPQNTRLDGGMSTYTGALGHGPTTMHAGTSIYSRPRGWFQLSDATRIDQGREQFMLFKQGGTFTKLQIKNLAGQTSVQRVVISYESNGKLTHQTVNLNRVLNGQSSLVLNLAHDSRLVTRIIVYGTSSRGSAYQLLAM